MYREMLKAKIHRATVTEANVDYEGSIKIDANLLKAARILVGEKVLVINLNNGSRVETYAILGKPGAGEISVNGGAALHSKVGDKVIIMNFCMLDESELPKYKPIIVHVNDRNQAV
ncbi:MAG: aspartate 1-decarboxylase [Candidatus Omnitrophica bacterium CG11_big_fil_rev_8_21_14_0_20_45_26]|uniref:Aspartate 1-decarboxylase n=1 Tax=Candidatus Abzuiibacterium crystallinum TaxID=1974748 RepID=A0A2H0LQE4_9BACT|nr:MAG: aspartate 1-decarboxylase [Candidatus Omnitrophica bacterium CG11_big_fil_rev_8_21_14_0_20_45_26]PIW65231.1 MAG: aspartate 1-decarboxylase [Candidatus Omnitrophica bacterium CG12_big_fil_rev_8_21_14_0_65_45_16]